MKVLYITSSGNIHDYRFLKKLILDYEVLLLHYASGVLIDEIKSIPNLTIISESSFIKALPLAGKVHHLKKVYNSFKPDIVHSGYVWQAGILASVLNLHPHLSMAWGSDILVEPDKYFFIKLLVKKVMKQCDHIQCDAEFVKQKIIKDYHVNENKITVFPWGIDLSLFRPIDKSQCREKLNLDKNDFIVIFNRSFEKIYGLKYMLEGFRNFSENKTDVKLILVAGGSMDSEIRTFINGSGLNEIIKLIGKVPNSEMSLYLNAADVYLSTALSDGSSLSLLEAMACELGIIVTDVTAIKEWISEKNGILVNKKDSSSVSTALEKYYKNRSLIKEHGLINLEIAKEKADWDKNYVKLKEIYYQLAGSK